MSGSSSSSSSSAAAVASTSTVNVWRQQSSSWDDITTSVLKELNRREDGTERSLHVNKVLSDDEYAEIVQLALTMQYSEVRCIHDKGGGGGSVLKFKKSSRTYPTQSDVEQARYQAIHALSGFLEESMARVASSSASLSSASDAMSDEKSTQPRSSSSSSSSSAAAAAAVSPPSGDDPWDIGDASYVSATPFTKMTYATAHAEVAQEATAQKPPPEKLADCLWAEFIKIGDADSDAAACDKFLDKLPVGDLKRMLCRAKGFMRGYFIGGEPT